MKFARLLGIFLMLSTTGLYAQNKSSLLLTDHLEQLAMEGEEADWQNQLEELKLLTEHPINLNVATRGQLEQLPFLSDFQIENIL